MNPAQITWPFFIGGPEHGKRIPRIPDWEHRVEVVIPFEPSARVWSESESPPTGPSMNTATYIRARIALGPSRLATVWTYEKERSPMEAWIDSLPWDLA